MCVALHVYIRRPHRGTQIGGAQIGVPNLIFFGLFDRTKTGAAQIGGAQIGGAQIGSPKSGEAKSGGPNGGLLGDEDSVDDMMMVMMVMMLV